MRLQGIQPDDLVQVSIRGRLLHAMVTDVDGGRLHFRPLCPGAGWRTATAREVVGHWRKAGRRATHQHTPAASEEASS
jgi:hypothetical protein